MSAYSPDAALLLVVGVLLTLAILGLRLLVWLLAWAGAWLWARWR